jgi:hypothetical protein
MLERQKIILFYIIFIFIHLHRETYFQSFDTTLIFDNKRNKYKKGKEEIVIHLMYIHTHIQTMHVGTILRQYVYRVVSSSTINRLFLRRPQK